MSAVLEIHLPDLARVLVQHGHLDKGQFKTGFVVPPVVVEADRLVAAIAQLAEAPERSLKSFADDALVIELDLTETEAEEDAQTALEFARRAGGQVHPENPDRCDQRGRLHICQVMPFSEEIARIILAHGNAMNIAAQVQRDGIRDLRQSDLLKVKQGLTSIEEVLACTNE